MGTQFGDGLAQVLRPPEEAKPSERLKRA